MILPWKRNELSFFLFFVLNFFSFLIYKFLFQNENNIENSGKETKKKPLQTIIKLALASDK